MACRIMGETTIVLLVYASEKQFPRSDHEAFPSQAFTFSWLVSERK